MKRLLFVTLVIILASNSFVNVSAQKSKIANVTCGPYVQCVSETGFTVVWTTDVESVAWVEIAPDDGTHFYNKERDKYYDDRGNGILPIGKIHKIVVDGLEPGTAYRYRIMSKGVVAYNGSGDVKYLKTAGTDVYRGKPFAIKTFDSSRSTIRFDIYNDIHGKDSLFNTILSGARENRDFVFLNGDMTSNISEEECIISRYLRSAATSLNGNVPLYASRGNHELRGREAIKWLD